MRHVHYPSSVILAQVHARIKRGYLIGVSVEGQRGNPAEAATDTALRRLRPARMIDGRVHVGVEAVLLRRSVIPRGVRLPVGEADAHDGLGALEAILPRDDEMQRRAILRWQ